MKLGRDITYNQKILSRKNTNHCNKSLQITYLESVHLLRNHFFPDSGPPPTIVIMHHH